MRVSFALPPELDNQLARQIPVTVLNRDMEIVARSTISSAVELAAGDYFVQTTLPNGECTSVAFSVQEKSADPPVIRLMRAPGQLRTSNGLQQNIVIPRVSLPTVSFPTNPRQESVVSVTASRPDLAVNLRLRELETGGLHGASAATAADATSTSDAKIGVLDHDGKLLTHTRVNTLLAGEHANLLAGATILLFAQPDKPVWHIRLPVSTHEFASVEYRSHPSGWFPHIRLSDARAELLLLYTSSQQASEFARIAGRGLEIALEGLDASKPRPVLASLGAYALLRTGRLEDVRQISDQIIHQWPDFPDAWAIAGEVAARFGKHSEALKHFLRVDRWPIIRLGLRFWIDRLRSYVAVSESTSDSARAAIDYNGKNLGEYYSSILQRLNGVDFDRPLVTFTECSAERTEGPRLSLAEYEQLPWESVRFEADIEPKPLEVITLGS